jgi:putative two-component system response regulator
MAIVDVYDALVSERPYKKAFSEDHSIEIILQNSGSHFDPKIAQLFYEIRDLIKNTKAGL